MGRPVSPGELWREAPAATDRFDPARLADLPEGARRLLGHALAPGAPLARAAHLAMRGTIRLGDWHPFEAEQVIVQDRGMVWAARVRMRGLPIRGADRLLDGQGALRWGNPGGGPFREVPFGGLMEAEGTFQGLTIPTRVRVGWWFGTERFGREGEFFRAEVTGAEFR